MLEINKGVNEDIFEVIFIDEEKINISVVGLKFMKLEEINTLLWEHLNINEKSKDIRIKYEPIQKYWSCNIIFPRKDFEDYIFKFLKYQKYVFVEKEDREYFKDKDFIKIISEREDIPIGYDIPVLMITFKDGERKIKVKVYDYQFKLISKEIYKRGDF